ncbi:DNA topoisomerase 2-binding protein 1-A-like isoform X2 [Amphibalanus amphitrite]|nr:DNA topoisomerase 2-binding protein 1-A-like isoform X2 [Amphibalanus amphitrite]
MESLLSQETQDQVNLYFVLPKDTTETTCSEKLASSYQACLDVGFPSQWIKEEDVLKMQPVKQDVFICDPFEGLGFDHLSSGKFKCVRVLGPPCLLACLSRSEPVPEHPYPLYTAAMRGMVVTSTGFQKTEKNRLQRLVRQMSGVYSSDFHEGITHLVAGVVASPKYQVAVARDVPVMRAAWVDRVWEASRQQTVSATDPQFADLACPPFQGLFVCVSQISRRDKEAIKRLIETNGGNYMTQLECEKTNVLISPSVEGEKVTFARRWKIPCVVPEWLYDSVERGSCLPMEQYTTSDKMAKRSSTPTKNHTMASAGELADLTMSTIVGANESRLNPVNETLMNETASFAVPAPAPSPAQEELAELDRVDLQEVAKAGEFLDGCKVHCIGLDARRDDKLRRLLNTSGAMRFSQLLPSVTHVVVAGGAGVPEAAAAAAWRPHLVTLRWVLASWRAGRPLPEAEFLPPGVAPPEPPAGGGSGAGQPGPEPEPDAAGEETVLPGAETTAAGEDTMLEATQTLFGGLRFHLSRHLDDQSLQEAVYILEEHGGRQVPEPTAARFTVVPLVHPASPEDPEPDALVTLAYLQHCVEADKLLEPEYFHRPISTTEHDILTGCVLGISSYSGRERQYLALLGESMGAEFQEVFARRDNPSKHARASTHLVCQAAEGHKYAAARKWGLPAVSREWLRACAAAGRRLPTDEYAVEGGAESTVASVTSSAVSAAPAHTPAPAAPAPAAVPAGGLPSFMQPPVELTPVRPPQLPPADSVARAAAADGTADMATPQTPYGALVAGSNPSRSTRKAWKRWVDAMEETPENKRRRVSTPMSQLVVQYFKTNFSQRDSQADPSASTENSPVVNSEDVNAALQSEAAGSGRTPASAVKSSKPGPSTGTAPRTLHKRGRPPAAELGSSPCLGNGSVRDRGATAEPPAADRTVTEEGEAAGDVSRQLAELNRLVSRRSADGSGASGEHRMPAGLLDPPPAVGGSESAPQAMELNTQGTAVTWDDPRERQARNNLMQEEAARQDAENVSPNVPAAPAAAAAKCPVAPVLVFSGLEPAERSRYTALAERLGGSVLDSATLEPSATHLVTARPNRSEKHLAAVASGRWLLQPGYLDACERAGRFLKEDGFEWGDPECLRAAGLSKDSTEYKLSTAAYRWRRKIQDEGIPGAFHSMVAVLLTARERSRAFERLVTAGGGRAASLDQLRRRPTDVTHVFIEPARADKRQLTAELWRELAERRLPCLQPVYLNECLTAAAAPRTEDWLLDEYKRLLAET